MGTFFPLPPVYLERGTEPTLIPGGGAVVPQGRAAGLDGLPEHRPDTPKQGLGFSRGEAPGRTDGMDSRPEQGFRGVDVPDPRDAGLVQEPGTDGRSGGLQPPVEPGRRELRTQGFRSQATGFFFPIPGGITNEVTEPPDVRVEERTGSVQGEADGQVWRRVASSDAPTVEKATRHPQVHENEVGPGKRKEDVLAPSEDPLDHPAPYAVPEGRNRLPQEIGFVNQHIHDPATREAVRKLANDSLDFRKLGHVLRILALGGAEVRSRAPRFRRGLQSDRRTAVPQAVTMSIPFLAPRTS